MYGFSVTNTSGHILVSDVVSSLHYRLKTAIASTETGATTFSNYGGSLEGSTVYTYQISLPFSEVPVVFIAPTIAGAFYGIISMSHNGYYWTVKIIQSSSTVSVPPIYVFTQLEAGATAGYGYGLAVYGPTGRLLFDGSKGPLQVSASTTGYSPDVPCAGGIPADSTENGKSNYNSWVNNLDFDFSTIGAYNTYHFSGTVGNAIFHPPSITQALYRRRKYSSYTSDGGYGQDSQFHEREAIWAVMYHQAYRLTSNSVDYGWAQYATAYKFRSYVEGDGGIFGSINSSGDSTDVSGSMPYVQKTINKLPTTVLITNKDLYDNL